MVPLKANPGLVGYGVVIRDNNGKIRYIMDGNIGFDSNNSVELWGLIRGIQLAF
jgi:ribonuclease HI